MIDVVTVYHCERNYEEYSWLKQQIKKWEPKDTNLIGVSNMQINRGFSKACNLGANEGRAPVIGFLNPDAYVEGRFVTTVLSAFVDTQVVIAGCRFGKPDHELKAWGCREWVCGAAMFVRRSWFEQVGGFHEGYMWGWEDTDLVRLAESQGHRVLALDLPITHQSPSENSPQDVAFKRQHFDAGAKIFYTRWKR